MSPLLTDAILDLSVFGSQIQNDHYTEQISCILPCWLYQRSTVPCKIMESVLRDAILSHVNKHDLSNDQHGFTSGRSCLSNHCLTMLVQLTILKDVTESLDEGFEVDIIYLEYSKAFDKVLHKRLISQLKAHGISSSRKK